MSGCPAPVRFAVLAAGLALLAACGGGSDGPTTLPAGPSAPTTSTAAPTATATSAAAPTPTGTAGSTRAPIRWFGPAAAGRQAPVQTAAKAYWSMVVRLAEKPDPDDPQLAALSVPPQRDTLERAFGTYATDGISQRGVIDGTVRVQSVTGSSAIVGTCLDQTFVKVYERSGRARPGTGRIELFTLTLRNESGAWKVQKAVTASGSCTIPR
jgi:hypothetical protein